MARNDGERRQALVCVLAETRKAAAIFKSRDYFTKRCLEIILLGSHARGMNMQSSHLDAIISEWPVSNGTKHGAQRIFPAAGGSQHIREGLRVLQRALGGTNRRSPGYASLHSCVAILENEHAAHDEALDTLKALKQRESLDRTQAPFNRF